MTPAANDQASPRQAGEQLALYRSMLRIRRVERAISSRYAEQEMRCPVHLSIGQEGAAVGLCAALRPEDRLFSTHRAHGHYLAKGGNLKAMIAELYGLADGCSGGRGGSMHLSDESAGVVASVPIVGSNIPLAVGSALAQKLHRAPGLSVACLGDAALEEGVFHESLNFASRHRCPVLFAVENNLYSVYTHLDARQPSRDLGRFAKAHNIAVHQADGSEVLAVRDAAARACEAIRRGEGPQLLVIDTYRFVEHCGPDEDDHLGYRPSEELELYSTRCPLTRARAALVEQGLLNADAEAQLGRELDREISSAFARAKAGPPPPHGSAGHFVYAGQAPAHDANSKGERQSP